MTGRIPAFLILTFSLFIFASIQTQAQVDDDIVVGGVADTLDAPGFRFGADIEGGGFWFSRNDVRIPGDTGTEFDMLDLIDTNPEAYVRIRINANFGERHYLRALYAPLEKSGEGLFDNPVNFEGVEFEAGIPVEGLYRFNTYRLAYRYNFYLDDRLELGAGAAVLVRDAKVQLAQGEQVESNTDLGFVPLLHFYGKAGLTNRLSTILDAEGLVSTQGRAIDAALKLNYDLDDTWAVYLGYRLLDGGADNDEVYNFAFINYVMGGVRLQIR